MKFSAQLDVSVVAVESVDEVSVMLDLVAPSVIPEVERPPATLQVVLDRSGSMSGPRLGGAIEALCTLVARLDEQDNFGVVVFDDTAEVVVAAGPLADKQDVADRLRQVQARGMTDLSGGYLRGLQELKRVAGGEGGTLLLISDGHANQGVTDPAQLQGLAASGAGERIVTSTLGYGLGYDESALVALARGGSGNHHFAEDPDSAGAAIASEVTELLDKSVQAASLRITMEPAVALVRLFNDLPSQQIGDGKVMVELGDLYSGEQRKLLLKFAVPAMTALGLAQIASLELRYVELPSLVEHVVTLPLQVNVVPGDEAAGRVVDPAVRSELLFQEAQQAKRRASQAAERGDSEASVALFDEAGAMIGQALSMAPPELVIDLERERSDLRVMRQRATWDTSHASKMSRASYHMSTSKRGRSSDSDSRQPKG